MLNQEYSFELELEGREAEGIEKGIEKGREKGREETTVLLNKLTQLLLTDNRIEDLQRACTDTEYQKQLLQEYGLIKK